MKQITNEEIDKEIERLKSLKVFEGKTADGYPIKLMTKYYIIVGNELLEIILTEDDQIRDNYLTASDGDFYFSDVYQDVDKCLEENISYYQHRVGRSKEQLKDLENTLNIAIKLREKNGNKNNTN